MKKIFILSTLIILFSCSKNNESNALLYDVTYTVNALNDATINKIEYKDYKGDIIEQVNVLSPWKVSQRVYGGTTLKIVAYGEIPYHGSLSITATWKPSNGALKTETKKLPNETPNTTINNGKLEISGISLPE